MTNKDVSVVIGFKDWGVDRLLLAIRSIIESFGDLSGEVIVSDYGSDSVGDTKDRIESAGGRYVYTETDGVWSRSRALNAGFAVGTGRVFISTDADMLFSPKSVEKIANLILNDPDLAVVLQCRDLSQEYNQQSIAERGFLWDEFERYSKLRPRWGMGGMMAVSREAFFQVRGLDERMHTYGGEDIDFTKRIQRAGYRLMWLEDDAVRMYHMWHPSSRAIAEKTKNSSHAMRFNKYIVEKDPTYIRNTKAWVHRPNENLPLVTVAISTYNRADFLKDSINSVLAQTFQDFEVVVIDDGSTDHTREVVQSFDDSRIRYFFQTNAGIASARNRAADLSRGRYTAVHDDDDLMVPRRLEISLSTIRPGVRATFGSWVNFDDLTGDLFLHVSKKKFGPSTSFLTGQAPGHATWLVETDLIRSFRYDESISSAVDNNLALRMMRSGIQWAHTGQILFMRRVHNGQVTETDAANQRTAAKLAYFMLHVPSSYDGAKALYEAAKKEPWPRIKEKDDLAASVAEYLPDHLVDRQVVISGAVEDIAASIGKLRSLDYIVAELERDGTVVTQYAKLSGVTLEDLVTLRRLGTEFSTSADMLTAGKHPKRSSKDESGKALVSRLSSYESTLRKTTDEPVLVLARLEVADNMPEQLVRDADLYRKIQITTAGNLQQLFYVFGYEEPIDGYAAFMQLKNIYPHALVNIQSRNTTADHQPLIDLVETKRGK